MSMYNGRMYDSALTSIFPIKNKARPKKKNNLQQKFATRASLGTALEKEDIQSLEEEATLISCQYTAWLKSLFCCSTVCRRSRKLRLQQKTVE